MRLPPAPCESLDFSASFAREIDYEVQADVPDPHLILLGTADRGKPVMPAVSREKPDDVARSTKRWCPVAQLIHEFLRSRWFHHQVHFWDGSQQSFEPARRHLGIVRQMEGAARGTLVLAYRIGGLENEGVSEAIEKPLGIHDAVNAYATGAAQRT